MPRTAPGHHVVTAYLCCKGAADALAFYCDVFGAVEVGTRYVDQSDGRVGHADFVIGDTKMMISDEYPDYGAVSPLTLGGTSIALTIYVDSADSVYSRAVAAGANGVREPQDQPYGDRSGTIVDPWGHRWSINEVIDRSVAPMVGFDLVEAAPTEH
jgi:PhnB protein